MTIGEKVLTKIKQEYKVIEQDIAEDAHLSKSGMHFDIRSFEIEGVGHMCIMKMAAMLGLMKMETVVISSNEKDVPLFNTDLVSAFGKETFIIEFYDTMLSPISGDYADAYQKRLSADSDIPEYESKEAWYTPILYPFSYSKRAKGMTSRFESALNDYLEIFVRELKEAQGCEIAMKNEKNASFVNSLLSNGGPAVNQFKKLFGEEKTIKIIKNHMYGV